MGLASMTMYSRRVPRQYLVWATAVVILYVACRWYAELKTGATIGGCVTSNPHSAS